MTLLAYLILSSQAAQGGMVCIADLDGPRSTVKEMDDLTTQPI